MNTHGQLEVVKVYKSVIPQYLLTSQKMDFLCFTEGLYKVAAKYVPDACAEEKALWCGCICLYVRCTQCAPVYIVGFSFLKGVRNEGKDGTPN
jgi:hypothetical protein